ncbi:MAG: dehydratase medium subunit [Sporomusa sp.]|jgi:hypothetical protein|nr:dehydratase medium subunit [Sporomusa sp.]
MPANNMMVKPSIVICVAEHDGYERKIREIQAGIEEEGVPYTLLQGDEGCEAVTLAWQGAAASQLGVGLGVSLTGLCIHYHKLAAPKPLFTSTDTANPGIWRQFGYNAARLVKGLPFKEKLEQSFTIEGTEEQLFEQIQALVKKILQENGQGHREVSRW